MIIRYAAFAAHLKKKPKSIFTIRESVSPESIALADASSLSSCSVKTQPPLSVSPPIIKSGGLYDAIVIRSIVPMISSSLWKVCLNLHRLLLLHRVLVRKVSSH